jgi:hypothetical protein
LGYANLEINAPGYMDTLFGMIFTTIACRAMHHAHYVKNYGLLTRLMDRRFEIQSGAPRARSHRVPPRGHLLSSLRERFGLVRSALAETDAPGRCCGQRCHCRLDRRYRNGTVKGSDPGIDRRIGGPNVLRIVGRSMGRSRLGPLPCGQSRKV